MHRGHQIAVQAGSLAGVERLVGTVDDPGKALRGTGERAAHRDGDPHDRAVG